MAVVLKHHPKPFANCSLLRGDFLAVGIPPADVDRDPCHLDLIEMRKELHPLTERRFQSSGRNVRSATPAGSGLKTRRLLRLKCTTSAWSSGNSSRSVPAHFTRLPTRVLPGRRDREEAVGGHQNRIRDGEVIASKHVEMLVCQRRQPTYNLSAASICRVVPQNRHVDYETQCAELIFLTLAVTAAGNSPRWP